MEVVTITGDGKDIRIAESPEYAHLKRGGWWKGGADNASDEERAVLDKEVFDLMFAYASDAEDFSLSSRTRRGKNQCVP